MKWISLFFLLILSWGGNALEGKTLIFFINGDWHYQGPVFEDEGIRIKDQANLIYRGLVQKAKEDTKNNYVLFYDPLGEGRLFNRKWVKLRVYKKGKKVFGLGLSKPEVETGSIEFYGEFKKIIEENLSPSKKEDRLFYYYGEHFPVKGEMTLDLSGNSSNGGMGLNKMSSLLETLGPFDTTIFHTCYLNALDYVGRFLDYSDQVLVPRHAILNTPLDWSEIVSAKNFQDFAKGLTKRNFSQEKYQWLHYGREVKKLEEKIETLEKNLSQKYWKNWWRHQLESDFNGLRQRGEGTLFLQALAQNQDIKEREIFVPLIDYVNLVNQYALTSDDLFLEMDEVLDQFPNLENLYKDLSGL